MNDKKQTAYIMYVEHGMTAIRVAENIGISKNTMTDWCRKGGWKRLRAAKITGPSTLTAQYYMLSQNLIASIESSGGVPKGADADALNKLAAAIQKVDRNVDAGLVMRMFMDFNFWLLKHDPNLTRQVSAFQQKYVKELVEKRDPEDYKNAAAQGYSKMEEADIETDSHVPDPDKTETDDDVYPADYHFDEEYYADIVAKDDYNPAEDLNGDDKPLNANYLTDTGQDDNQFNNNPANHDLHNSSGTTNNNNTFQTKGDVLRNKNSNHKQPVKKLSSVFIRHPQPPTRLW